MCTAVVGGSTHRAARRISAERDQRSPTAMTSHRIKDRRKRVRGGGWVGAASIGLSGMAVTFQNNSLSGLPLMDDLVRANKKCCVLLGPLGTSPLVLNFVSMRLECPPGFKQRLQAGKNTRPSISAGSVCGVILGPLVMCHRYFRGFGLGHQFDRCARRLIILAHCEGVLKNFWRLKPQDLPSDVGHGLTVGSRAHPCEQATRLKVRLNLSAPEDDPVRLPRPQAFPHLLRGGGNVDDIFLWCLMRHDCSVLPAP